MKTNRYEYRSIVMALLAMAAGSVLGGENTGDRTATAQDAAVFYHSLAVNFGLPGYTGVLAPARVLSPTISYQSLAYGPAIHGYPQWGEQPGTAWNMTYVSPAFGQYIYSYPAAGDEPDRTGRLPSIIIE